MTHSFLFLPLAGFVFAPAVVTAGSWLSKRAGGLLKKGSPRYQGGPLISTVNGELQKVANGDIAELSFLWNLGNNPGEKDRKAWRAVWDNLVPQQPLTDAQRAVIIQLDPTKKNVALGSAAFEGADKNAQGEGTATQELFEPVRAAAERAVQDVREAAAQAAERAGVGGGAAAARALRGGPGVLDRVIAAVKKPGGAVVAAVAGLVVIGVIVAIATRRGR